MHRVLERQIKRALGTFNPADIAPGWMELLKVVSETYEHADEDRQLSSRSLDLSSREFAEINRRLRMEHEIIEQKVKERTEELTKANERLTELDKLKTEFISVAAHQLRTPLTAIKWTLDALFEESGEALSVHQRSLLFKAQENNERMLHLIGEMLVVTRIESGKMQFTPAFTHIDALIESVLLDFAGQAQVRHMQLSYQPPADTLPMAYIDAEKIRAVIQNLIENAFNYTKDHGTITVTATAEGSEIRVCVKDDGIGIPKQQQSGLFNKFFRADNAAKVKTDGSGLGLFVAKRIIERHHGTIGFESSEKGGTTFYFTVPSEAMKLGDGSSVY